MKRTQTTDSDDSTESALDRRTALSQVSSDERTGVSLPNRRGFLAGTLASVAAGLGFSVPAAAGSDPVIQAATEYDSPGAVRSAVAEGTRALRSTLAGRGYLATDTTAELLAPDLLSIPDYLDADEGIVSYGTIHDGEPTAGISITRQFDGYALKIVLYPEMDETYAVVRHDDGDAEVVLPGEGDGPSTQGHTDCEGCLREKKCDAWWDGGGQRWCIPKIIFDCDSCGFFCHDDSYDCMGCSDYC